MEIRPSVLDRAELCTQVRRELHVIPELCGYEVETQGYICAFLEARGIRYRKILTGVIADFEGRDTSNAIAFRADIDGLPIAEKTGLPFASQSGNMHACGHDGHTAILLTLCDILTQEKPPQNIRAIFQFGEEGARGAEQMIAGGALEGVSEIYALHLDPTLYVGEFASCVGAMMAGAVELSIKFRGCAAHCAEKEKGIDALKPLAQLVDGEWWMANGEKVLDSHPSSPSADQPPTTNHQLPEKIQPLSTLFHVGAVTGGTARNVVAGSSEALCTLRYFSDYEAHMARLEEFLKRTDAEFGTSHELRTDAVCPPLINAAPALARVRLAAPNLKAAAPRYTAEDFACFLTRIPGSLTWLGIKDAEFSSPLHSDTFGFSESALLYGVEFFMRILEQ
ncbi:MAG: M20 family metallopeptidase [Firmicutes bacterium]|nr:M20 family metallopeptidase [Bacillota bacterium]